MIVNHSTTIRTVVPHFLRNDFFEFVCFFFGGWRGVFERREREKKSDKIRRAQAKKNGHTKGRGDAVASTNEGLSICLITRPTEECDDDDEQDGGRRVHSFSPDAPKRANPTDGWPGSALPSSWFLFRFYLISNSSSSSSTIFLWPSKRVRTGRPISALGLISLSLSLPLYVFVWVRFLLLLLLFFFFFFKYFARMPFVADGRSAAAKGNWK